MKLFIIVYFRKHQGKEKQVTGRRKKQKEKKNALGKQHITYVIYINLSVISRVRSSESFPCIAYLDEIQQVLFENLGYISTMTGFFFPPSLLNTSFTIKKSISYAKPGKTFTFLIILISNIRNMVTPSYSLLKDLKYYTVFA